MNNEHNKLRLKTALHVPAEPPLWQVPCRNCLHLLGKNRSGEEPAGYCSTPKRSKPMSKTSGFSIVASCVESISWDDTFYWRGRGHCLLWNPKHIRRHQILLEFCSFQKFPTQMLLPLGKCVSIHITAQAVLLGFAQDPTWEQCYALNKKNK